jgi:hypothetical protein
LKELRSLLERYQKAEQEMEALQAALARSLDAAEVVELTRRPSSVLEALWDNEADAVYDDL